MAIRREGREIVGLRHPRFRLALVLGVVLALLAVTLPAASADPPYTVCQSGCPYSDILSAVNAAPDGGTVTVGPGTYTTGQITISKGLTLQGAGQDQTTISGNGANAGVAGTVVIRNNSGMVTISGFTFTNPTLDEPAYNDWISISAFSATAPVTIEENRFAGMGASNNPGDIGLYVVANPSADTLIENNEFTSMWQGLLVENPQASVTIRGNSFHELVGSYLGTTTLYEPEGTVVLEHSGITDNQPLIIDQNQYRGYSGMSIGVDAGYPPAGTGRLTNVQITNNIVDAIGSGPERYHFGISVRNPETDPADAAASGTVGAYIANNVITGSDTSNDSKGIWIDGYNPGATLVNNVVTGVHTAIAIDAATSVQPASTGITISANLITKNAEGLLVGSGNPNPPVVHYNQFVDNTSFEVNNQSTTNVDAICNWWGSQRGPTTATTKGHAGDSVIGNVSYAPWLRSGRALGLLAQAEGTTSQNATTCGQ